MTIQNILSVWSAVLLMLMMTALVVAIIGMLIETFKKNKE